MDHGGDRGRVALHGVGAPLVAVILVGLSAVVVSHPPPIGPVGLVCFAAGTGVIAMSRTRLTRRRRRRDTVRVGAGLEAGCAAAQHAAPEMSGCRRCYDRP